MLFRSPISPKGQEHANGETHSFEDRIRLRLLPCHTLDQSDVVGAQEACSLIALRVEEETSDQRRAGRDGRRPTSQGIALLPILALLSARNELLTGVEDMV